MNTEELFFELLRLSVGACKKSLAAAPTDEEWAKVYEMSKRQTLVGVCYAGVQMLPDEQRPPRKLLRQWALKADKIAELNRYASADSRRVSDRLRSDGFQCMVLKGQGNRAYYPEELRNCRVPGDIDIWVWPTTENAGQGGRGPIRRVIEYCQSVKPGRFIYYHDMDWPVLPTTVEVHYRPTWLYSPLRNRRLQRWLKHQHNVVEFEGYHIPTVQFNAIFQLLHLYKHIFEEGIGFRQLVDYYFVLQSLHREATPEDMAALRQCLSDFGLKGFAGDVMYIMRESFAMPDDSLLCPPDTHGGPCLLDEIIRCGNFGKYDTLYKWSEVTEESLEFRGVLYAWTRIKHNLRFLKNYPEEVLWEPVFRMYHYLWRRLRLWRWE